MTAAELDAKIKQQANALVDSLMQCTPHYIRCIKVHLITLEMHSINRLNRILML